MALALEVGFYGILRTGELLSPCSHQVEFGPNDAFAALTKPLNVQEPRTVSL